MNRTLLVLLPLLGLATGWAQMTSPRAVPERTVTADIWADNWFALYVNGALVKEDGVPISTERSFNAETVTFTTPWPAQVALVMKDYKADDTGLEYIGTPQQQMGDGGVIAQFRDAQTGEVLAVTDASARVYVTHHAPLESACAQEVRPQGGYDQIEWVGAAHLIWSADLVKDNTVLIRLGQRPRRSAAARHDCDLSSLTDNLGRIW